MILYIYILYFIIALTYKNVGAISLLYRKEEDKIMLNKIVVRRFQDKDAEEVTNLITRNFKEVNIKDYGKKLIDELLKTHDVAWLRNVASFAHMYVFEHNEQIVAVGSISSWTIFTSGENRDSSIYYGNGVLS